jgi:5'-methylthioadenosine phosphorylase
VRRDSLAGVVDITRDVMITAMGKLALVGGHGFHTLQPWAGARKRQVSTERGAVGLLEAEDHLVLPRHGIDHYRPAHLVDHARNLAALLESGSDRVLAICSAGSLHPELPVGSFICPSDFVALGQGEAVYDDERGHVVPAFDPVWRRLVLEAWSAATDLEMHDAGIYWQSPGPRFETPAEVRLIAEHADVVGMTMASECIAACQLGLAYAAICVVDNLANGIGDAPLTRAEYEAGVAANRPRLVMALGALLPAITAEGS